MLDACLGSSNMSNLKLVLLSACCVVVSGCYDSTPRFSSSLECEDTEYLDSNIDGFVDTAQTDNEITPEEIGDDTALESVADLSNDFQPSIASSCVFVNMLRVWKDSKNEFSTNAELMAVAEQTREIRLLKQNGVVITVPYEILSDHDKNYVAEFISAERQNSSRPAPKLVEFFDN